MEITADVLASFRSWPLASSFFSDTTKWPDNIVIYALTRGDTETGSRRRWGAYQDKLSNFKQQGMFYFACGILQSYYPDGVTGALNGEARLNTAGKSVGDESTEYRVPAMMDVGTDWMTYTVFGQEFYRLLKRAGKGAVVV